MTSDFERILKDDPGNPAFVDFAKELKNTGNLDQAQEVCLRGLSANPGAHLGRLLLAHLFYEKGYFPFAAQQIQILTRECHGVKSLARLLAVLSPDLKSGEVEPSSSDIGETLAETEFDLSLIDEIEENNRSPK